MKSPLSRVRTPLSLWSLRNRLILAAMVLAAVAISASDFAANAAEMNLIGIKPSHHSFGLKDAELIAPNAPERSVLAHRITTNGDGKMPPLGRNVTDPDAVRLIEEWIRTLPPTKNSPPK